MPSLLSKKMTAGIGFPWLEFLFLFIFAYNLINQLLIEPIIGLANNGDFYRLMDWFGLEYLSNNRNEMYFSHINRFFTIGEPSGHAEYLSSELLFVKLAINSDHLFTQDLLFNLTYLGALHACIYLVVITILMLTLQGFSLWTRIFAYLSFFFVFGDVAYIAYFNSIYSEPASLLFLGLSLGFAFLYSQRYRYLRHPWILILAYYIAVLLFVFAKPQNTIVGVPLAVLGVFLALRSSGDGKVSFQRAMVPIALALLVILISIRQANFGQPADLKRNNLFNIVFFEILKNSSSPLTDMAELGITNPEYVSLIGNHVYEATEFAPELVIDFQDQVGYSSIFQFFARHPERFIDLIGRGSQSAFKMRPPNLGNFEITIKQQFSQQMNNWSELKGLKMPRSLWFLVSVFTLSLLVIVIKWVKFDNNNQDKAVSAIHFTILVSALSQFIVVIIGEGEIDIVKQLFLFNALIDANFILILLYLSAWILKYPQHMLAVYLKG
jgi:hypothetical protein